MLSPSELRQLTATSGLRTTAAVLFDWAVVAAVFALAAAVPNPLVWLLCAVLLGRQQIALAVLMHDASHSRLYKRPWLNDLVGQVLCAGPVFFSLFTYRRTHMKHHRAPLAPDDPDLRLTGGYPISRASLYRKLLRDLVGISYFKLVFHFLRVGFGLAPKKQRDPSAAPAPKPAKAKESGWPAWAVGGSIVLAQGAIFAAVWATGHPWLFALWIGSMMTVLQLLLRVRGLAEHAGFTPNDDQRYATRTVVNPLQTFLFAPHNVNFHIEHHLHPGVPAFRLPEVHRLLQERGTLPPERVHRGYGSVLREVTR